MATTADIDASQLVILYGSETGTAEEVAFRLAEAAEIRGISSDPLPVDSYVDSHENWLELLAQPQIVIFVCCTTGDGEVPSNMRKFWKTLLRRSLPQNTFSRIQFSVFGLGDSSYEKFNGVARKLNTRLKQLGAQELCPIGLGDDQSAGGYFDALVPWSKGLWRSLGAADDVNDKPPLWQPRHSVEFFHPRCDNPQILQPTIAFAPPADSLVQDQIVSHVVSNTRITAAEWQYDVRNVVLDTSAAQWRASVAAGELPYRGGDVAVIHPRNGSDAVQRMLAVIRECVTANGLELQGGGQLLESDDVGDVIVRLQPSNARGRGSINALKPLQCPLRELLTSVLDIEGLPQRLFLQRLSLFCTLSHPTAVEQRDKLIEMSGGEGADVFIDYIIREKRTYFEVLEDFRYVRPPLHLLIDMISPLRPRAYSIASSPAAYPDQLHICAGVVEYTTRFGRRKRGVCSKYLAGLQPGDNVIIYVRRGPLRDLSPHTPLVCVAAGTGVAPMRALFQERAAQLTQQANTDVLLFGCRNRSTDYLYGEEWEQMNATDGSKQKIFTAFSRDTSQAVVPGVTASNRPGGGYYVQDLLTSPVIGNAVWQLLSATGGTIFIAGNTKMPKDVKQSLVEIISRHGNMHKADAEGFLRLLAQQGRYHVEAWDS